MANHPIIFVSHAGANLAKTEQVASYLTDCSITVLLDSQELVVGSNIIEFMNSALNRADYCLLLWSQAAEERPFVRAEWQAAFAKEIIEQRLFLMVARLEAYSVPTLLQPRLYIDLFPEMEPGLQRLVALWKQDRAVEAAWKKEVLPPLEPISTGDAASQRLSEVYCSSKLFDCVIPLPVDLGKPAGLMLQDVRALLKLPDSLSVGDGALGMRLSYRLLRDDRPLDPLRSSRDQNVSDGAMLNLEITTEEFSHVPPATVTPSGGRQYRSVITPSPISELHKLLSLRGLRH